MAGTKTISERLSPVEFTAGADCADSGVVKGVCICGLKSANGRDYPADVLRKAVSLYEGAQVYLDHLDERGRSRGVREWFGEIRNVRSRPDGRPEGDLHFPAEHHFATEFASRAKNFKRSLGLSHVVEAKTSHKNGREVVEEITRCESVDLVASPATNTSLTESRESTVEKIPFRQLLESLRGRLKPAGQLAARRLLLAEMDDPAMGGVMDAPVDAPAEEPMDEPAAEDAIDSGIRNIVNSILDDGALSTDEKLKKIRLALQMGDKLNGDAPASSSDSGDSADKPASESKLPSLKDVVAECEQAKLDNPPVKLIERLTTIADAETRAFVIEQARRAAKVSEGVEPRSLGRGQVKVAEAVAGKNGNRITWDN